MSASGRQTSTATVQGPTRLGDERLRVEYGRRSGLTSYGRRPPRENLMGQLKEVLGRPSLTTFMTRVISLLAPPFVAACGADSDSSATKAAGADAEETTTPAEPAPAAGSEPEATTTTEEPGADGDFQLGVVSRRHRLHLSK
jgi:hypothetical protein